jgi:hypothetical protein
MNSYEVSSYIGTGEGEFVASIFDGNKVLEAVTIVVIHVGASVMEIGVTLSIEMIVFSGKQASTANVDSTTVYTTQTGGDASAELTNVVSANASTMATRWKPIFVWQSL